MQNKLELSRRKITGLIDQGCVFINWERIESYKQDLNKGDLLLVKSIEVNFKWICDTQEIQSDIKMFIFNKPVWYVVSKSDPNNKTIYEILPKELKNYYYIGRLDKDSHWLLLLTNDPKLVNEYEHPKHQIEKEYIVQIDRPLRESDIKQCLIGLEDEWETLQVKKIETIEDYKINQYRVILTEWKKRHIRRIFRSLWCHVIDLQRIREWEHQLWELGVWELRISCAE